MAMSMVGQSDIRMQGKCFTSVPQFPCKQGEITAFTHEAVEGVTELSCEARVVCRPQQGLMKTVGFVFVCATGDRAQGFMHVRHDLPEPQPQPSFYFPC